jgi:hypothetical protein
MRKIAEVRSDFSQSNIAKIGKRIDIRAQKLYNIFTNLSAVGEKEVFDG